MKRVKFNLTEEAYYMLKAEQKMGVLKQAILEEAINFAWSKLLVDKSEAELNEQLEAAKAPKVKKVKVPKTPKAPKVAKAPNVIKAPKTPNVETPDVEEPKVETPKAPEADKTSIKKFLGAINNI